LLLPGRAAAGVPYAPGLDSLRRSGAARPWGRARPQQKRITLASATPGNEVECLRCDWS
jgi:hypothetical protein